MIIYLLTVSSDLLLENKIRFLCCSVVFTPRQINVTFFIFRLNLQVILRCFCALTVSSKMTVISDYALSRTKYFLRDRDLREIQPKFRLRNSRLVYPAMRWEEYEHIAYVISCFLYRDWTM